MAFMTSFWSFGQSNDITVQADVDKIDGVPVYFLSSPINDYYEVGSFSSYFLFDEQEFFEGAQSDVYQKLSNIVRAAKRKARKGKIDYFDALLVNPKSFHVVAICFYALDEPKN